MRTSVLRFGRSMVPLLVSDLYPFGRLESETCFYVISREA